MVLVTVSSYLQVANIPLLSGIVAYKLENYLKKHNL